MNGYNVVKDPKKVREQIGYMPDFFGVYDQLKAEEYLDFYGASYGIPIAERKKLIPQLLELVNLSDKRDSYVDLLSRGMKQRLCLARSLIHDPKVLILDEPASGLDPRARVEMREILKELKKMGKTILISSHILPELAEMCDVIGIIDQGSLKAQGSVAEIQDKLQGEKSIVVKVHRDIEQAIRFFENHPDNQLKFSKTRIVRNIQFLFRGDRGAQQQLLKACIIQDLPIISFAEIETDLEDVFMEIRKG